MNSEQLFKPHQSIFYVAETGMRVVLSELICYSNCEHDFQLFNCAAIYHRKRKEKKYIYINVRVIHDRDAETVLELFLNYYHFLRTQQS